MKHILLSLLLIFSVGITISQKVVSIPEAVEVKKATIKLNGTLNSAFGGMNISTLEVVLPPNTQEWYYSFTTKRDKEAQKSTEQAIGLTVKIASLLSNIYTGGTSTAFTGLAESSVKSIALPDGSIPINTYAIDTDNRNNFMKEKQFNYFLGSSNESQVKGSSLINFPTSGVVYIALQNPNLRSGVLIDIEVSAIVMKRTLYENSKENNSYNKDDTNDKINNSNFKIDNNTSEKTFYIKNITDTTVSFDYSDNGKEWKDEKINPGELKKIRCQSADTRIYIKFITPQDEIKTSEIISNDVFYFKRFMSTILFSYFKD